MKLDVSTIANGKLMAKTLPQFFSISEGFPVVALPGADAGYRIGGVDERSILIEYCTISDMMTALGDILAGDGSFSGEAVVPALDFRAVMLDVSRNGVPKVSFLKSALMKLALMGMNHFCLYTEDTFELDGEPLIGYGRGRYSKLEIGELVSFGAKFGITLFPCIQTLGHLAQILKYPCYEELADNKSVLNVKLEKTYSFIEKLIDNAVEPYDTNLIHIGTDEPWGLGRGNAFDIENPVAPGTLYAEHIARVGEILEERGLKGIIWGDYIFGHSGEEALSSDESDIMPKSMIVDYWGYSGTDVAEKVSGIDICRAAGYQTVVSPGVWNWNRFFPNMKGANATTKAFMAAAHTSGIKMALTTMWGDDGQESFFDSNWGTLAYYLALCRKPEFSDSFWQVRAELVSGGAFKRFELFNRIENPDILPLKDQENYASTTKALFYDDPLIRLFGKIYPEDNCVAEYFSKVASEAAAMLEERGENDPLLELASLYSRIIAMKFGLSQSASKASLAGDRELAGKLANSTGEIISSLREFSQLYKKMWLAERKPFGLEVIDLRLGGLEARLRTFEETLEAFASGTLDTILELNEEFPGGETENYFYSYARTVTPSFSQIW